MKYISILCVSILLSTLAFAGPPADAPVIAGMDAGVVMPVPGMPDLLMVDKATFIKTGADMASCQAEKEKLKTSIDKTTPTWVVPVIIIAGVLATGAGVAVGYCAAPGAPCAKK